MTDALPAAEGSRPWSVCNDAIDLPDDHPFSMLPTLAMLLESGYQVLLYNGENDLSCNFEGTEMYLDALEWKGKKDWAAAARSIWRVRSGALGGKRRRRRHLESAAASADADGTDGAKAPSSSSSAAAAAAAEESGVVGGYYRSSGPLHFLVVLNSGYDMILYIHAPFLLPGFAPPRTRAAGPSLSFA